MDSRHSSCSILIGQLEVVLIVRFLTAYFAPQNTSNFSLVMTKTGEIVTEDGRSRCPFNPEYKSTAIMVGKG